MKVHKLFVFFTVLIIVLALFFILPAAITLLEHSWSTHLIADIMSMRSTLWRTICYAMFSALGSIIVGFFLAVALYNERSSLKGALATSILIIPTLLGNLSVVYVFKQTLYGSQLLAVVLHSSAFTQLIFLAFLQWWHYGFLFTYMFLSAFQSISLPIRQYAVTARLSPFEKVRDVFLPSVRNLILLLFSVAFIFCFFDEAKSQFLLKSSEGQGTELISHWVVRSYNSQLLINATAANATAFGVSALIFVVTLLTLSIAALVFRVGLQRIYRTSIAFRNKSSFNLARRPWQRTLLLCLIALIILTPIWITLKQFDRLSYGTQATAMLEPVTLAICAAALAFLYALVFSMVARLALKWLRDFNDKTLLFTLGLFLLQLIVPIALVLCAFKWLSWTGYSSIAGLRLIWIALHCLFMFPILSTFLTVTHFSVSSREIEFYNAHGIGLWKRMKTGFISRFTLPYVFMFLFSFTFIWNDDGINMVLSDNIPSFATTFQMFFVGRAADAASANAYLLVGLTGSLACLCIWLLISFFQHQNRQPA